MDRWHYQAEFLSFVSQKNSAGLPLFSKLCAVLHKTVARKIVETVPTIKIMLNGNKWTVSVFFQNINQFFRLFIFMLNLKQLRTNTIKKLRCLYCWFGFDICTTFWPLYSHIVLTTCLIDGTISSNSQRELWWVGT